MFWRSSWSSRMVRTAVSYTHLTLFTNSDLSIAMGDYSGDNLIFNGHNKLDVTSGDIELALKDYTLNVQADSHSGEVYITNNLKISKDNTLTITSDLGDITVE